MRFLRCTASAISLRTAASSSATPAAFISHSLHLQTPRTYSTAIQKDHHSPISAYAYTPTANQLKTYHPLFPTTQTQTRLYSSLFNNNNNNNNNPKKDDDDNILTKITNKARKLLPKNWGKSDAEIQTDIQKQKRRDEISGGLSTMLKDFPLPIRMMGKLVAPMLSTVAEQMGDQARMVQDLMEEAQRLIMLDGRAVELLGEPIRMGAPFSQSSSTMSVNGRSRTEVQTAFEVYGRYSSGVVRMSASGGDKAEISSLRLDVGGRVLDIDVSGRVVGGGGGGRRSFGRGGGISKDDVIDAEFVEKK